MLSIFFETQKERKNTKEINKRIVYVFDFMPTSQ